MQQGFSKHCLENPCLQPFKFKSRIFWNTLVQIKGKVETNKQHHMCTLTTYGECVCVSMKA